jgi:hydroxymethylpyrimidine/phosphomethylpyrimidine kinase
MDIQRKYRYATALTIAGSDSSGGAGIQADLKTFSALGVYGMSAITSITAQNTLGVRGIQPISSEILRGQLNAVFEDSIIDAVKTGMLHNKEAVEIVAETIDCFKPAFIVVDPVMISTSGSKLIEDVAIEAIITMLFSRSSLITPNIDEAELLTGMKIRDINDMSRAAYKLMDMGCHAVLMKGGHLEGEEMTDMLFLPETEPLSFSSTKISTKNTHGTGCTFSSAIAAYVALGYSMGKAVEAAKGYITKALSNGANVQEGHGYGPLNHLFDPQPIKKIALD